MCSLFVALTTLCVAVAVLAMLVLLIFLLANTDVASSQLIEIDYFSSTTCAAGTLILKQFEMINQCVAVSGTASTKVTRRVIAYCDHFVTVHTPGHGADAELVLGHRVQIQLCDDGAAAGMFFCL